MKRGFLLRAEERKAAAKRRGAVQKQTLEPSVSSKPAAEPSQYRQRLNRDVNNLDVAEKLAYGNLSDEQKALPSDYDLDSKSKIVMKESDPGITEFDDNTLIVTTIPGHSGPKDEAQCEWVVNGSTKAKVLNAPGYPARIPKPHRPDLFEVKWTPDMGYGLFAKRNMRHGDLILAERPLLVSPRAIYSLSDDPTSDHYTTHQYQQVLMFEYESLLEKTIDRSSRENQAAFRALHNAHTGDGSGPLLGIIRSNGYGIDNLYDGSNESARYGAVCKIGSRINHSCMPNVLQYFTLNSFSMQFYATRDIKAGEQLFYSYSESNSNLVQRRAEIAPYGFVCKCPACVNATPETDKLRNTYRTQITHFEKKLAVSSGLETVVDSAVRLEKAMVKEGLHVELRFGALLKTICLAYAKLGKMVESKKYEMLVEEYQSCHKNHLESLK